MMLVSCHTSAPPWQFGMHASCIGARSLHFMSGACSLHLVLALARYPMYLALDRYAMYLAPVRHSVFALVRFLVLAFVR